MFCEEHQMAYVANATKTPGIIQSHDFLSQPAQLMDQMKKQLFEHEGKPRRLNPHQNIP
jgi:hypothetical protein